MSDSKNNIPCCNNLVSSPPPHHCKTGFVFEVRLRNVILSKERIAVRIDGVSLKQVHHSCGSAKHVDEVSERHPIPRSYKEEIKREVDRQLRKLVFDGHVDRRSTPATKVSIEFEIVRELESRTPTITARSDHDDDDDEERCAICLESMAGRRRLILRCGHMYHVECMGQWICRKAECPLCRDSLLSKPNPKPNP